MKNVFSKNKKYIAEYRRWFDKLPKKQKALMKQLGLDKPHIDDYTTRQKFDVSDIQIANETQVHDESDEKKVYSRSELRNLLTDYTEKILHEIVSRRNLNLTVESMLWLIGRSPYSTEQQIASAFGQKHFHAGEKPFRNFPKLSKMQKHSPRGECSEN